MPTPSMSFVSKLPRRIALPVIAALLSLVILSLSLYAYSTYKEQQRKLADETKYFTRILKGEFDAVYVRLKDLNAFLASGAENLLEQKLKSATRHSSFMSALGYMSTHDIADVRTVTGPNYFSPDVVSNQVPLLLQDLIQTPGLGWAVSPQKYPELFPALTDAHIIVFQVLQTSSKAEAYNIVYAVVDLRAMLEENAPLLQYSSLTEAKINFDKQIIRYDFPYDESWISSILHPHHISTQLNAVSNLSISLNFKEHFANIAPVIGVGIELGLICLVALILSSIHLRSSKKANRALRSTLKSAELANEAKSVFLANMSHEIRTPLNGVLGMAELLSRTNLDNKQRRLTEQIRSSGNILLSILNDILDLSKLESSKMDLAPVRTNLPKLLQEVMSFYASTAKSKGNSFLIELHPDLPEFVIIDPTRLRQVLGNLLSNACKFTENGQILLKVGFQKGGSDPKKYMFDFSISDTGIGISEENIEKLFNRFSQAESSTTRQYGGTGLGLSICKQLVELMEGQISVNSKLLKGSTFTFSVPIEVLEEKSHSMGAFDIYLAVVCKDEQLTRIVTDCLTRSTFLYEVFKPNDETISLIREQHLSSDGFAGVIVDEGDDIDFAINLANTMRQDASTATMWHMVLGNQDGAIVYHQFDHAIIKPFLPKSLLVSIADLTRKKRNELIQKTPSTQADAVYPGLEKRHLTPFEGKSALLVDDNNVNLFFGQEILQDIGFKVTTAENGQKAVQKAKADSFDVILMDCQMPVMDGYEATKELRLLMKGGNVQKTPIIAVTANALKGDREKCLDAGMDEFLSKPLQVDDLNRMLATFLPETVASSSVAAPLASTQKKLGVVTDSQTDTSTPEQLETDSSAHSKRTSAMSSSSRDQANNEAPGNLGEKKTSGRKKLPLIDVETFKNTYYSMKNFDQLLLFFKSDTTNYLSVIKDSLQDGRIEETVMPAHTIKSSSRIIGAQGLASLAENFEKRARTQQDVKIQELKELHKHMVHFFNLSIQRAELINNQLNQKAGKTAAQ